MYTSNYSHVAVRDRLEKSIFASFMKQSLMLTYSFASHKDAKSWTSSSDPASQPSSTDTSGNSSGGKRRKAPGEEAKGEREKDAKSPTIFSDPASKPSSKDPSGSSSGGKGSKVSGDERKGEYGKVIAVFRYTC
ncbi:unnamed protein product, partial [Dibothriocephalus latus]